jgi:hypothetical protein
MTSIKQALIVVLAIIASTIVPCTSSAGPWSTPNNITGSDPPKHVGNWTRLSLLGRRFHPFLVIWLSPESFPREGFEKMFNLNRKDYARALKLNHSYACLNPNVISDEPNAVQVTEYSSNKGELSCRLPANERCEYLNKLSKIPGIHRSASRLELLRMVVEDAGCL